MDEERSAGRASLTGKRKGWLDESVKKEEEKFVEVEINFYKELCGFFEGIKKDEVEYLEFRISLDKGCLKLFLRKLSGAYTILITIPHTIRSYSNLSSSQVEELTLAGFFSIAQMKNMLFLINKKEKVVVRVAVDEEKELVLRYRQTMDSGETLEGRLLGILRKGSQNPGGFSRGVFLESTMEKYNDEARHHMKFEFDNAGVLYTVLEHATSFKCRYLHFDVTGRKNGEISVGFYASLSDLRDSENQLSRILLSQSKSRFSSKEQQGSDNQYSRSK